MNDDDWVSNLAHERSVRRALAEKRKLIREGRARELAPDFVDSSETQLSIDAVLKSWAGRDANE